MCPAPPVIASLLILLAPLSVAAARHWHQPAGPNGNWQVEGSAPTHWSVVRNENIRWRTAMPEAGMSAVTIWGNRIFTTTHVPIETEKEKKHVTDIIGFCLDAEQSGERDPHEQRYAFSHLSSVFDAYQPSALKTSPASNRAWLRPSRSCHGTCSTLPSGTRSSTRPITAWDAPTRVRNTKG